MIFLIHYYVNGIPTYKSVAATSIPKAVEDIEDDEKPDAVFVQSVTEQDGLYTLKEKMREETESQKIHEGYLTKNT